MSWTHFPIDYGYRYQSADGPVSEAWCPLTEARCEHGRVVGYNLSIKGNARRMGIVIHRDDDSECFGELRLWGHR